MIEADRTRERPGLDEGGIPVPDVPPAAPGESEKGSPKLLSTLSRCPYCHDEIRSERADWVACEGCLARHHRSCWSEHGSCATCHARGALGRLEPTARADALWARRIFAVTLLALLALFGARFYAEKASSQNEPSHRAAGQIDDAAVARLHFDERKLAYIIQSEQAHGIARATEVIDLARRYHEAGSRADSERVEKAADALMRSDLDKALELLGLAPAEKAGGIPIDPATVGVGDQPDVAREIAIEKARNVEDDALRTLRLYETSGVVSISDAAAAKGRLLDAAAAFDQLGLTEDAKRALAEARGETARRPAPAVEKPPAGNPSVDRQRARACVADARARLKKVAGGAKAEDVVPDAQKLLEQAADDYAQEGLTEASARVKRAVEELKTGTVARALEILSEKGER